VRRRTNVSNRKPNVSLSCRRFRNVAGLASVVVPFGVAVHLGAEAAAVGHDGLGFGFVVRHGYFVALIIAAAGWFASTVGIGRPESERRRRCAILRSDLSGAHGIRGLLLLAASQLAFFGVTQAAEGVPVASGGVALGLGVALAGSLLSAVLVFFFGRSLIVAGLDAVIGTAPVRLAATAVAHRDSRIATPRRAASAFSLFVPNRPPPNMSRT
jgi:hypothetical protein